MPNPVVVADLEDRWRPLDAGETVAAVSLLGDAWAIITSQVEDVEGRLSSGALSASLVVAVETAMVLRVLRNPDGKRQESIDDYSYTIDTARSAGLLYATPDELALLRGGSTSGAFTVRGRATARRAWDAEV